MTDDQIALNGHQLALVGLDMVDIPSDLGEKYGDVVKMLDLSYNSIEKLDHIDKFVNLTSLVADNNKLESSQPIPRLEGLRTLSVNNNNISDLKVFLDCIKDTCPHLTYLSMLKNPACPNEFTGRDSDDYQRYRYYVLFRFRNLRFLDSTPVSEEERKEALRIGGFALPARPDPSQYKRGVPTPPPSDEVPNDLPPELKPEGVGKASFGVSNYVYYGRQSEGNRFIMNDDL